MAQVGMPPRRRVPATSYRSMTTLALLVAIVIAVALLLSAVGCATAPYAGEVPLDSREVAEASPELAPVATVTSVGLLGDVEGSHVLLVDAKGTLEEPDVPLLVPSDAVIFRDGKEIARDDLTEGDAVRVFFEPERGNRVTRLDVLQGEPAAQVTEQTLAPVE